MIKSMTGYGRGEAPCGLGLVTAELRAVNHRFCDVVIRVPRTLLALEEDLKRMIQQRCARGRIELSIVVSGAKDSVRRLSLDHDLARQYHGLLRDLKKRLRLSGAIDVALLAGLRDIIGFEELPTDDTQLGERVKHATQDALATLDEMRRQEGASLAKDLQERLTTIETLVATVTARAPLAAQDHFTRMKARLEKLLGTVELDTDRLHQELAIYADRGDVTEELTRMGSHIEQFRAALSSQEPVGRAMDFLVQEMGREVNTVGSKANDAAISSIVVKLKGELEKVREQVQNIE